MPLLAWFLNVAYLLLIAVASPILLWRMIRHGKYRDGFAQKVLGRLPETQGEVPVIWLHAVSVGEVLQLETIVHSLAATHRRGKILITTTTSTGLEVARRRFPQHESCYFPLDFSWAVSNAIRRVRPSVVVLVELELWPNFILHASRFAKVAIINGRLSDRSFRGYRRIRQLVGPVFSRLTAVGAQTAEYADRMLELGAKTATVTGSIKFDRIQTNRDNLATRQLRELFQIAPDELIFVAGSTQHPEEELAVRAWQELRDEFPRTRLIVVPRHKERFEEVVTTLAATGTPVVRRSDLRAESPGIVLKEAIVVLDTLGELSDCWGLADVAFVGGSFGNRGGQNMIEPAAFGAAVLVGPNTVNFRDVMARFVAQEAVVVVEKQPELVPQLRRLLGDPALRARLGQAAQKTVLEGTGASEKTLRLINAELESASNEPRQLIDAA